MIDKKAPAGRVRSSGGSAAQTPSLNIVQLIPCKCKLDHTFIELNTITSKDHEWPMLIWSGPGMIGLISKSPGARWYP